MTLFSPSERCAACHTAVVAAARYCRHCGTVRAKGPGAAQPGMASRDNANGPAVLPASMSAVSTLDRRQMRIAATVLAMCVTAVVIAPVATLVTFVALSTVLYLAVLAFRIRIFTDSLRDPQSVKIDDGAAASLKERGLPTYTILVPAYREPEVIRDLLEAIARIDYPRDRLEVKLILEEDDEETYRAAIRSRPGPEVDIIRVPYSEPRTKPKACNYALRLATGRFVTIYDAEDRPDPLQLRRAVAAFRRLGSSVACLQAKLAYHNADQNLITRWFATEYDMWFSQLLPGLVSRRAPLPLGGTSNHFRRAVLERVGGWDPHNVTEDADLGIRLHRMGYRTEMLESTTFEEANSDFVNWVKQRSRWYKGYLQTWFVHMRDPRRLASEIGYGGVIAFSLFVAGTPILALLNPLFWGLTIIWFAGSPELIQSLFPAPIYYAGMLSMVVGNVAVLYMTVIAARLSRRPTLVFASLLVPVYWAMMSVAAIKAVIQLVVAPSFWEKTVHGLDRDHGLEKGRGAFA